MGETKTELTGPDLAAGVPLSDVPEGSPLLGHCDGEAVLLTRKGDEVFAVGATCTHYSGPLAEGLVIDTVVHCPWHHASFCLRTGRALSPPALDPVPVWETSTDDGVIRVTGKRSPRLATVADSSGLPDSIVIIGAGAAGNAAAEMLRNEGFKGTIALVGAEPELPTDRPNLSKDYLAGDAPKEWLSLRDESFYAQRGIELFLGRRATAIDPEARRISLDDGRTLTYQALLVATGAEPRTLDMPGAEQPFVHTLRTRADSEAIIEAAKRAAESAGAEGSDAEGGEGRGSAVVVGASFIGLEVAASLRKRGLRVRVVAPEAQPLARVLGPELGAYVRSLHEGQGVAFHLGHTVDRIEAIEPRSGDDKDGGGRVILDNGETLEGDFVVLGVGVRPAGALVESAGLSAGGAIDVDAHLQTKIPGIYAAGDVARWPDRRSGENVRVEHWAVAQRMGQVAALNLLGRNVVFDAVPFFWSRHYDVSVHYVGHAPSWDRIDVAGDVADGDCAVAYRRDGATLAVATVGRPLDAIRAQQALGAGDEDALSDLVPS